MSDAPKIFRIIFQVSDLDAASEFYETLLNTKGRRVASHRHYFVCGPVILALVDPSADDEEATPNPDYTHFTVSDIKTAHKRAGDLNCLSKGEVHGAPAGRIVVRPWGERSFYCNDPFGNGLCFVDETTVFTGR